MTDCDIWPHGVNRDGYGFCKVDGVKQLAHRAAYARHHGLSMQDIFGKVVRHTCDTPACCNPAHLILGDQLENMHDMVSRGRRADFSGERHGCSVLTAGQVAELRAAYVPKSRTNGGAALGRRYGITTTQANRIATGKRWKGA